MNDNEMQESLRIVLAVIVIIIFIFFIHNLWIKVVSTPLSSKGIEGDVHGVLVHLNGLNAMINGSKPLIHMSDERCKLTIQVGYHGIKGESLWRRRSNRSLRSIFDIGGWHTLWKLDIVHLFTIVEASPKIHQALEENKHKIVIIVPGRSKIGHKLPLPKESKIMEVERVRGEEGNGNPTLTTNTVILKLLEVLQSIGMTRFIEAPLKMTLRFGLAPL
ncbi:hypothetical protein GQ457_10G005720 [Hibiscus cannabinus]